MQISLLNSSIHKRENFSSGVIEFDDCIIKYASQDIKRNLSKVFVAHQENCSDIVGYYTLSSTSFGKNVLSADLQKKLPSYPLPAVLIGRLAVSREYQGKGLGSLLLLDALTKVHHASEIVFGIYAVTVEAKDKNALVFYQHFGFISFRDTPFKLYLPLKTIQELFFAKNS